MKSAKRKVTMKQIGSAISKMQASTIDLCVADGCGSHYQSEMSQCLTCGRFMCHRHVCECLIDGIEEMKGWRMRPRLATVSAQCSTISSIDFPL